MNRETARTIAVAILCVLAIGAAAATLNSAESVDSGDFGVGDGDRRGFGNEDRSGIGSDSSSGGQLASYDLPCFPILTEPGVILALLGAMAVIALLIYRRAGIFGSLAFFGAVGIPAVLLHALLTTCTSIPPPDSPDGSSWNGTQSNGSLAPGGGGFGESTGTITSPSIALTLLLGLALVVGAILLVQSTGDDEPDTLTAEPETSDEAEVAAVGRAAGAAADRIERDADVANEVFRAWREMTDHLDVSNPDSSTPAEFAAAAVAAGMNETDVSELTTLFEEVRYGGETPTEERERRAVTALRRIEDVYSEDDL